MTNEERDVIARFIERVAGGAPASGGFTSPAAAPAANLPPVDRDADSYLAELFQRFPEARYRISQLAYVQEQALTEASKRIGALQNELQQVRQQQSGGQGGQPSPWGNAAGAAAPAPTRGFFGSLFGGGSQPRQQPQYASPPPYQQQPQYAQPQIQQAGMLGGGGSGFFGSALTTAAGVAGGMVAGNALMNLFEGHHGGGGFADSGGGGGFGAPTSYEPVPVEQPWGAPPAGDAYDVGGASKSDGGFVDNSSWSSPDQGGGGGWTDTSGGDAGSSDSSWTDTSDPG